MKFLLSLIIALLFCNNLHALKILGNWCGPYHPRNFEKKYKEPLPHYVNATDKACRTHDFIYTNYWSHVKANQMNPYFAIYDHDGQYEADRLLIRDIEDGLNNPSEWGCEETDQLEKVDELQLYCRKPLITKGKCNREKADAPEKLLSRVVQIAMYVKIMIHFKIGESKENPQICNASQDFQPPAMSTQIPIPSFCTIRSKYSTAATFKSRLQVVKSLKRVFYYFKGIKTKVRASKVLIQMLKKCKLEENLSQDFYGEERKGFDLNSSVVKDALQASLEDYYKFQSNSLHE